MQENYIVGIYARLSRDDERAGESVSIENQKEMLSRYVREQGWTLYDYYCDDGVSGTTFDRPSFIQMENLVEQGVVDTIIVKDLSRFGRNYLDVGNYLEIKYPTLGVRFIAIQENVDIGLIDIPTEDEIKSLMAKIKANPQEYRLTA